MKYLDNFLNKITMYKLLLYYLIVLLVAAAFLGYLHDLPYSPAQITVDTLALIVVCLITNKIFSYVFSAVPNVESAYLTALILALIITPGISTYNFTFLFWAGVWAMASKFIFAINKKHIFNPAAIAVVITAFIIGQSASWWVGTPYMLPLVIIGGVLMVRKIHRTDLVVSFFLAALFSVMGYGLLHGQNLVNSFKELTLYSPLFFLGFVMLTEPLTTPPTRLLQIIYGAFTGLLFSPNFHLGTFYPTPEVALSIGNIFSYLISPKIKLQLVLERIEKVGDNIYDFVFPLDKRISFQPGQYLEWTLATTRNDDRGNRRYFTLASSPTEENIRIGVKFYPGASSFKQEMAKMKKGSVIIGNQLSGNFTLPKDPKEKLVWIAGGIGVTPFRSMAKYLIDTNQRRDIALLYSVADPQQLVYRQLFEQARSNGITTHYTLTDKSKVPSGWADHIGFVDKDFIVKNIPDYLERTFYLSGPHAMVASFQKILKELGIPSTHVKLDYFPGFS